MIKVLMMSTGHRMDDVRIFHKEAMSLAKAGYKVKIVAKGSKCEVINGIEIGYNKSQETHPFTEEDMIEFDKWKNEKYKLLHSEYVDTNDYYSIPDLKSVKKYTTKELLQLWKEQRTKTLYYE